MDQNNNKVTNILSVIGIVAFFIVLIVITVFSFKNKEKSEEDYYAPVGSTSTPIPITTPTTQPVEDITTVDDLLYSLCDDIERLLQCDNVNYLNINTPGIKLDTISGIRAAYGQSSVDFYQLFKSDSTNATTANKGEYLITMNIRNTVKANILYVYVWTDYVNGAYVISGLDFEIGDF